MPKKLYKPLSAQHLAYLYLQLSRLEESGIPTQETIAMLLSTQGEVSKRAKVTLTHLKRGKSLSEAGAQAGLFIDLDAALIKVAEVGGTQAEVFKQLAQFYEEKTRQTRQIKSRLILPIIVFLLAIFIQPIPTLVLGKMTFGSYLEATIGFIIQLTLLVFIFLRLPQWFRYGFLRSFRGLWDKVEIYIPYFGDWYVRQQIRNFMRSLGLMLQAGLPILDALPKAYAVVENFVLRQRLQKITIYLQKGYSFAEAATQVKGINSVAIQIILAGEHAGSLADMMLHYVKLESEAITLHNEIMVTWIPRIVYALIVAWMIYGILTTVSLVLPSMPEGVL